MKGKLKDLSFNLLDKQQVVSFVTDFDCRELFDKLKDVEIEVTIKQYRKHRSLDANSYCWVLCTRLADEMSNDKVRYTKEDIYRETIRQVGIYKDFTEMEPSQAKTLQHVWAALGTGWITEQVDWSQDGERVTIRCYYGSSQYNTKQMSRLIDSLVQDCKALGIPTETPEEIENLKSLWKAGEK